MNKTSKKSPWSCIESKTPSQEKLYSPEGGNQEFNVRIGAGMLAQRRQERLPDIHEVGSISVPKKKR
jgi:hypothetical protein